MNRLMLIAFSLLLSLASCDRPAEMLETADVIYFGGSVWTGVEGAERAEAIAIKDGLILAVGGNAEIEAYAGADTAMIDLEEALTLPGFIDNHTHFISGGFSLSRIVLRDADTPAEFARRVGEFAAGLSEGRWILGGQWDHELWGGDLPRAEWIDALTPEVPVFVTRYDGHMSLANAKAMAMAGITDETPDPDGGTIVRDADGRATGVFKDAAIGLFESVIPAPTEQELDEAFEAGSARALSVGITQIHDMGASWSSFDTYLRARDEGRLNFRIYSFVPLDSYDAMAGYIDQHGRGDDWLRWGGLKGYVDGSLGSTTALFHEPYLDEPDTSGLRVMETDRLFELMKGADAQGLHLAVHAIGDKANDWLLDAFAEVVAANGARDRRFRIEHAQHLSKGAFGRFKAQGVIPSMQPYHAIDDGRWAEKRIGPDRILTTYAFSSLLEAGAALTFGSDWTVAPLDPLQGIYAAVTRQTLDGANPEGWVPGEKISVEQALRAYTIANAYAGFQEDKLGTLEAGKLADFVVLSDDIFAIPPDTIKDVTVTRTIIGGEEKYKEE